MAIYRFKISFEDYDVYEFAENDPRGFLSRYNENVIFDEIQRNPKIISYLQTHVDKLKKNGTIVITGSHNFLLMELGTPLTLLYALITDSTPAFTNE